MPKMISGRQKKKFRRLVNAAIQSGVDLRVGELPLDIKKGLQKQVYKASAAKKRHLNKLA